MAIAGALIGGAIGAFGEKPVIPTLATIDPNQVQQQTVAGNLSNFSDIAKLASNVNTFNQDQLNALIDRALPGARGQIQQNISSQLRGELPADVQSAIQRSTAARAVSGGFEGSGFGRNLTARDLGMTSYGIISNSLSSAESWLSASRAPQMDATSMFFNPQQRLGFLERQQQIQFQRDLMAAQVKAAPDPATAALGQEIDRFFNTAASVGMMAAGGAMGGGGGMGGGMGGGGGGMTSGGGMSGMSGGNSFSQAASSGNFSPSGFTLPSNGGGSALMYGGFGGGGLGGGFGGGGMGSIIGSANGQGLPGIGQSNLNGTSMWSREFGSMY